MNIIYGCGPDKYPECNSASPLKRWKHKGVSENALLCGCLVSEAHVHEIVFVMFSWSNKPMDTR